MTINSINSQPPQSTHSVWWWPFSDDNIVDKGVLSEIKVSKKAHLYDDGESVGGVYFTINGKVYQVHRSTYLFHQDQWRVGDKIIVRELDRKEHPNNDKKAKELFNETTNATIDVTYAFS